MKDIGEIKHIVEVGGGIGRACEECSTWLGSDSFDRNVNHFLQDHEGYQLLSVGTRSTGDEGDAMHFPIAILGK